MRLPLRGLPRLDLSDKKEVQFWVLGDTHIGSAFHLSRAFSEHRRLLAGSYVIHVGDALEMVTPASPIALKGALREQILSVEEQRKLFVEFLRDFPGGIVLPGNHEFRIDAVTGLNFVQTVVDAVGGKYIVLEAPGMVNIRVGEVNYYVVVHHGEGPYVSPTTLFDRLQRDYEGADIIVAGHIHSSTFDPAIVRGPKGDRIVWRIRVGHYVAPPRYALVKPVARMGAPGSWVLTLSGKEKNVSAQWLPAEV
jgi:predicted phosphodiesterase